MKIGSVRAVVLGSLFLFGMGCATTPTAPTSGDGPPISEETMEREREATMLTAGIWDVQRGEFLEPEEFFERIEEARFVLVGESHGTEFHHRIQGEIYREMTVRRPGEVLLGMEMVEHRFQEALDGYLESGLREEELLEAVQWSERWGVDPEFYAPMWRLAKAEGQRVVGLNAERELVRRVREVGIENLNEEEMEKLPEVFLGNEEHREFLFEIFSSHGMGDDRETIERFYQAQVVWDEAMAETASAALEAAGEGQMMIIAGRFHVERGYGIPSRVVRRGADEETVVIVLPVSEEMEGYRKLEFLQEESIADFVWVE